MIFNKHKGSMMIMGEILAEWARVKPIVSNNFLLWFVCEVKEAAVILGKIGKYVMQYEYPQLKGVTWCLIRLFLSN